MFVFGDEMCRDEQFVHIDIIVELYFTIQERFNVEYIFLIGIILVGFHEIDNLL